MVVPSQLSTEIGGDVGSRCDRVSLRHLGRRARSRRPSARIGYPEPDLWNDDGVIGERALERRVSSRTAIMVLHLVGLWLALVILYPFTVVAIASVLMPPHPLELLALGGVFAFGGAMATLLIVRFRR